MLPTPLSSYGVKRCERTNFCCLSLNLWCLVTAAPRILIRLLKGSPGSPIGPPCLSWKLLEGLLMSDISLAGVLLGRVCSTLSPHVCSGSFLTSHSQATSSLKHPWAWS